MESRGEAELAPIPERKTSGTACDTAWTARITDENGTPTFPECIKWFLEHQKEDGSWGGQILKYLDRIISTLSALPALKVIDGKTLYTPVNVVFSSMVSVSIMYICVWNRCSGSSVCWVNFPETLIGPVIP